MKAMRKVRSVLKRPFREVAELLGRFESDDRRGARVKARLSEIAGQRLLPASHVEYLKGLKARDRFEPKVIFDVGACVLHWSNEAARIWPEARLIAFEAMEAAEFIYWQRGIEYHLAVLSDVDGKSISFFQNELFPGGNSYYQENEKLSPNAKRLFGESNKISKISRTLDAVVQERGFPQPDLIKIDVQGAELDVLKGARKTLGGCRHLILELQHVEYNKGAPLKDTVIDYVLGCGFELVTPLFSDNGPDGDYHFARRA